MYVLGKVLDSVVSNSIRLVIQWGEMLPIVNILVDVEINDHNQWPRD